MSWSFEHDWFKKFVEQVAEGDVLKICVRDDLIRWQLFRNDVRVASFHLPHCAPVKETDDKGHPINHLVGDVDAHRFYAETFLGYTLTLRGLALSKPRISKDSRGNTRLPLLEKYGMAMLLANEHPEKKAYFDEREQVEWVHYTIINLPGA